MSKESMENHHKPVTEMVKRDTDTGSCSMNVDESEGDEKRDIYALEAWVSSVSAFTSLSEFALSRISDHSIGTNEMKLPTPCPCDVECDLESCGSSCSYSPTREIDSNMTITTLDGFSPMHISQDLLPQRNFSVALQTDPVEVRNNCTQTHRRWPRLAQSGMFSVKKSPSVQRSHGHR